jgi:hypothetical protein
MSVFCHYYARLVLRIVPEVFSNESPWLESRENPARCPALFLEFLPKLSDRGSRLIRLIGRTDEGVIVRSAAVPEGCLAGCGGFLFVMDGDGDCVDVAVPLVLTADESGRFILPATFGGIVGVTTGPIVSEGDDKARIGNGCEICATVPWEHTFGASRDSSDAIARSMRPENDGCDCRVRWVWGRIATADATRMTTARRRALI